MLAGRCSIGCPSYQLTSAPVSRSSLSRSPVRTGTAHNSFPQHYCAVPCTADQPSTAADRDVATPFHFQPCGRIRAVPAAAETHAASKCLSGPRIRTYAAIAVAAVLASALHPDAASAWQIRTEPSNALSVPTWAIHVSSVYEWGLAMGLMWKYADVTGRLHIPSSC